MYPKATEVVQHTTKQRTHGEVTKTTLATQAKRRATSPKLAFLKNSTRWRKVKKNVYMMGEVSSKILSFFDQALEPKSCTCGHVCAFNIEKLFNYTKTYIKPDPIWKYVSSSAIGCVKNMKLKFRSNVNQYHRFNWFKDNDIQVLDKSD